jgi:outer membrane immunogenic protein
MGWLRTSVASGAPSAISGAPHGRHRDSSRRGRGPRAGLAALALILLAPAGAVAADMPEFLRGSFSPSTTRWDGFYFGGQAGKTFGSADFGKSTSSMVSYILANTELENIVSDWTTLSKGSTGGPSFGGFIGYNFQWDDVVLGGELNYNRMSLDTGARDTVGPILVPGHNLPDGSTVLYSVTETSNAAVTIHDIVTARARAGWAIDRFLPYGFVGLAVGRFDYTRFASVDVTKSTTPPPTVVGGVIVPSPPGPFLPVSLPRNPQSQSQDGVIAYGFTAGLGVEVALMQNLFVRAEWEFIEFPNVADFRVSANSARVGVGLKF